MGRRLLGWPRAGRPGDPGDVLREDDKSSPPGRFSLIRLLIKTWEDRVKANLKDVAAEQGFLVEQAIEES